MLYPANPGIGFLQLKTILPGRMTDFSSRIYNVFFELAVSGESELELHL